MRKTTSEYLATYRAKHKDELRQRRLADYKARREHFLEQRRLYRQRNPDKIKEYKSRPEVKARQAERVRLRNAENRVNPEWVRKQSEKLRRYHLKRYFGLSVDEYNALAQKQGNKCAICDGTKGYCRWGRLHVDHCHKTKKVRALLCSRCNLLLGHVGDDPSLLRKMADYLEQR